MFNMFNIRNNSRHLIPSSFCLKVFRDFRDLIFLLYFRPFKIKYSHFCVKPIPYVFLALRVR